MDTQKQLFDLIRSRLSNKYLLVDVIEDVLQMSSDSAYRRIRCERELKFSELLKLCRHFHISMDEIANDMPNRDIPQEGGFRYTTVNMVDQPSYIRYIKHLRDMLRATETTDNKEMCFTAQDIPFYHFLELPELMFFKLYVWYDIVSLDRISFNEFCSRLDSDVILPIYKDMHRSYIQIPSKELWTNQTIDTILRLLDYYTEIGAFDSEETIIRLLNQVIQLLDAVETFARSGYKDISSHTPFLIYICSVDMENNFMLMRQSDRLLCTIKLHTVNSITTDHPGLCGETEKWINDLLLKSIRISGDASERERIRFFQATRNKVNALLGKFK
jgi:hypothetical protein